MRRQEYVPALGLRWLTGLYDPLVAGTTRERTFKGELLRLAALAPGERVLDLGCGTGTLAIRAKRDRPEAFITGIDGDAAVLARAADKAARAGVVIGLQRAFSHGLPFRSGAFDVVLSSLFFHHLSPEGKRRTLAEVYRVLAPGGRLLVADWGRAASPLSRLLFLPIQLLDGFEGTSDNVAGRLPGYMARAGFHGATEAGRLATIFGTLAFYGAAKPADG